MDALEGSEVSFLERAKAAAGQAAKVSVEVGGKAAKAAGEAGGKAARAAGEAGGKAAATLRDPATQARAKTALKKAKRGITTILERIDPRILADVVVKATSLQERANASLKERNSAYRIGQIQIGASIPPSILFSIERIDDPNHLTTDSSTLLANAKAAEAGGATETIMSLDGTAIDAATIDGTDDDEDDDPS